MADKYNFHKVATNDYKAIIDLHEKYEKVRKKMEKLGAIMQPVRAIYIDCVRDFNVVIKDVATKFVDLGVTKSQYQGNNIVWNKNYQDLTNLCGFVNNSSIVGYFVAIPKDKKGNYSIGFSYCRPDEFEYYNKEYGIVLAFERAMTDGVDVASSKDDMQLISFSESGRGLYLWPITYGQQVYHFLYRCSKYFKKPKGSKDEVHVSSCRTDKRTRSSKKD